MIAYLIKFSFVYFYNIFISFKLNKFKIQPFLLRSILFSICISLLSYLLDCYYVELKYTIPSVALYIYLGSIIKNPQLAFILSTISFCISYSLYALSSLLLTILCYTLFNDFLYLPYYLLAITTGILEIILINFIFKIKRFKIGLIYNNSNINLITFICLIFIILISYVRIEKFFSLGLISSIFILTFLIYWWQAQITKTYRRRLELRELESLRAELSELNEVVQQLKDDNERLARISHRDNSLISALRDSTLKYLSTDYENPEDALEVREKLIQNINALSEGRASALPNYEKKTARDFDTGLPLLDELLHHMDGVAIENGIILAVHFSVLLNDFVPAAISEEDLVHTVDDLLKNAYKSTLTHEKRLVQLQFFKLGKHFVVEVADNGIPFEARSLVNMGLEALTTYEDGSGIGLMDIWGTKEKYRATYHLDEYETSTPFSKKISLIFDKKNRFSILTSRKNEILKICNRLDLQVYSRNN